MTIETDQEIARLVQAGDKEAFGLLIERYEKRILRYGRRFLSDNDDITDVVQDVFVKAYININDFDVSRSFSSWIYRIAHNEYVNRLKKKKQIPFSFFEWRSDIIFPHLIANEESDYVASSRIDRDMLEKCMSELVPNYREVLVLSFYEELSYQEISEILHVPISTVGVRLRRAREAVRKIYEKKYGTTY